MHLEQSSKTVWIDANSYPPDSHYFECLLDFRVLVIPLISNPTCELNKQNETHLTFKCSRFIGGPPARSLEPTERIFVFRVARFRGRGYQRDLARKEIHSRS